MFDDSDDTGAVPETNPSSPTTLTVPASDDIPDMSLEEAAELVANPILALPDIEDDPLIA